VLSPAKAKHRVTLIASGSEISIALEGQKLLEADGVGASVVSMPCLDIFNMEDHAYQDRVIPPSTVRIVVEAGSPQGWDRWTGREGAVVGMTTFGASAPYEKLYQHFGITPDNVVKAAKARL
jgi:transketolase